MASGGARESEQGDPPRDQAQPAEGGDGPEPPGPAEQQHVERSRKEGDAGGEEQGGQLDRASAAARVESQREQGHGVEKVVLDGGVPGRELLRREPALQAVRSEGAMEDVKHVVAYVDQAARSRFQADLVKLPDQFESAEAKLAADGLFAHLAATIAQRSATNLLQGTYAPKSNWLELARPWRVAATLLLAVGVLALVLQGAEYWSLRRADGALAEQLAESCQRLVGANRTSQCDAEVQNRLRKEASGSSETFLSTLAAVAAARNPNMRFGALSYRNQTMDLQLIVANVDELDAFARSLEQTRRFAPKIESTGQGEDGVIEGRLQIAGAHK